MATCLLQWLNWRTLEDETPDALYAKEKLYREIVEGSGYESARLLHDTWCAAFVWPKQSREYGTELTSEHLRKIERNPHSVTPGLKAKVHDLALQYRFFHWHLEFPTVFGPDLEGGFDIMLGNPPWERVKLQEEEFFASRDPGIANAKNAAARKKMIAVLPETNPALATEWETALQIASSESKFLRLSGRYPLGGVGDVNTYAVFADLFRQSINTTGAAALLLPNGLVTGFTYRGFLRHLLQSRTLASFYGFENEDKIFPEVHNETKFGILTMTGTKRPVDRPWFTAHIRQPDQLQDPLCRYSLTAEQIEAINPNTLNLPAFRWAADAAVAATIHDTAPVFLRRHDDGTLENSWGVRFGTMFHMANDSGLFLDHADVAPHIVERHGALACSITEARCILYMKARCSGTSTIATEHMRGRPRNRPIRVSCHMSIMQRTISQTTEFSLVTGWTLVKL